MNFFKKEKRNIKIPVEVSARHCHLSQQDLEKLVGEGYKLKMLKQLGQPSDFAAEETIDIEFGSKKIERVRVVGPVRQQTQVEISLTDTIGSGVTPPVKLSGDLAGSVPVKIVGPAGEVNLENGLIVALRHIHCTQEEASKIGLKNGDAVAIQINSERPLVFQDVLVRIKNGYSLGMHVDTDEGNAAGINKIGEGIIL